MMKMAVVVGGIPERKSRRRLLEGSCGVLGGQRERESRDAQLHSKDNPKLTSRPSRALTARCLDTSMVHISQFPK